MSKITPEEKALRAAFFDGHNLRDLATALGTRSWLKLEGDELIAFVDTVTRTVAFGENVRKQYDDALKAAHSTGKLTNLVRFRTRETKKEEKEVDVEELFG